jgi:anaerobic magnesium-protoporphyrin IX monomethyl ester cyclase
MNILFYNPPSKSEGYPEPPLGLGYLMSIARNRGMRYDFYDHDHHAPLLRLDAIVDQVKPDLFIVTCMTPQYPSMQEAIALFRKKRPGARIAVGGPHPSALPRETLQENPEIDIACKGEGEQTFDELLIALSEGHPLADVKGLFFRTQKGIVATSSRALMPAENLDSYPVDWEMILRHGPYIQRVLYSETPIPVLPVITTRGCPFECTFCDEGNIWERRARSRSVSNVIEEITYLIKTYGVQDFNILDDTFTVNRARCMEICDYLIPLKIRFRITANIKSVTPELLQKLKLAGCQMIAYGVESGDNDVLRRMKKRQTVDDVKHAFRISRETGITTFALCMVGNLGETFDAVKRTRDLIREIDPDHFSAALMTPYPGSTNYAECSRNGWILHRDWSRWVPSVMKTTNYVPPSRTDTMDTEQLLHAYFFMNRFVLLNRYRKKYGRFYFLKANFVGNEILPRIRSIGIGPFLAYLGRLFFKKRRQ